MRIDNERQQGDSDAAQATVAVMEGDEARLADMRQAVDDGLERALEAWPRRWSLKLVDNETGEVLDLPQAVTTEQAYEVRALLDVVMAGLRQYAGALEGIVAVDMETRGASERLVRDVLYAMTADSKIVVNQDAMIRGLKALVEAGEIGLVDYEAAVKSKVIVDTTIDNRVLNGLLKRGALVQHTIEAARERVSGRPKLVVKRAG